MHNVSSFIIIFANTFVLMTYFPIISNGICNLNTDFVLATNHQWPKQGLKTLLSLFGFFGGYFLQIFASPYQLSPVVVLILMCLSLACLFTIPNLVIQILLLRIFPRQESIIEKCKIYTENFQKVERAFSFYFFVFFSSSQFMIIFQTFLTVPSLVTMPSEYILSFAASFLLQIFSLLLNLLGLTSAVDESYDDIRRLRREIQHEILNTKDDVKLKHLDYWKSEAEMLKPMNAAGFFEIDKTTLTSMMSVRYLKNKLFNKNDVYFFL